MTGMRVAGGVLGAGSVAGWVLLGYFLFVLPRQVAGWAETGRAIPVGLAILIRLGRVVQFAGIPLVLLLAGAGVAALFLLVLPAKRTAGTSRG